jgi:hypothetical protein
VTALTIREPWNIGVHDSRFACVSVWRFARRDANSRKNERHLRAAERLNAHKRRASVRGAFGSRVLP